MKFINIRGELGKARRSVSSSRTVSDEEVQEPRRLSELLRILQSKLSVLESKAQPEATEFEVTCSTAGALVKLNHGFNCPVRWFVTSWKNASGGHSLVWSSTSTSDTLVLASYVAGTAVIRVEPSQYELT